MKPIINSLLYYTVGFHFGDGKTYYNIYIIIYTDPRVSGLV